MHSTTQVQPQIHRFGAQSLQPARRSRRQVQGQGLIGSQQRPQPISRLELGVDIIEPKQQGIAALIHGFDCQLMFGQCCLKLREGLLVGNLWT